MDLILLLAASLLFAIGGLFMKYAQGLTRLGPSVAVFALFCTGAACQTIATRRAEMGVAYIFVLGLEAILAFLLSIFLLNERASVSRVCAVVLIVAGIALLERS